MKHIVVFLLLPLQILAQQTSFKDFKSYPFPTELTVSSKTNRIAWALDELGHRNIYVASGPDFHPVRLTHYDKDDGQEISSLSISDDGKWIVFVRGGDHGANWDSNIPINPAFDNISEKVQVLSIAFEGGTAKVLSDGDDPVIAPVTNQVAFIKAGQVWVSNIDSPGTAKNAFATRGTVNDLEWSADGSRLLFVANRSDHSIIGIYNGPKEPLQWLSPSFERDENPHWSEDGKQVVYTRIKGRGGAPDSILPRKIVSWSIRIADVQTGESRELWKSPATLKGSYPSTDGGSNLHWAANDRIVFVSYEDGWPHLYSIPVKGGAAQLLTSGKYIAEHIRLSPDKKWLCFSTNAGPDKLDIDRRHAARVSVDHPGTEILTAGNGLEWMPDQLADGKTIVFISATATRPPLPAVMDLSKPNPAFQLLGADLIPANFPEKQLVIPRQVIFSAADGVIVHAELFEPAQKNKEKFPAIVFVHGGPPRQMLLGWHYSDYYSNAYASNQYLASLGFVVLSVNYRLGIGYGYDFHHPPHAGSAGAAEYRDIVAAGQWLQLQPNVDSKKIGIYGGSYGGYLTALALARDSKMFAAGVDFHGVHDWAELSSIVKNFSGKFEKAPDYEKALQVAWQSSPVASISTWKSPVLIIQGDDDRNVPFNQSVDLINRLEKQKVHFETLMIVDDTHHWMKFSNAVKVYSAAADYFLKKLK